MIRLQVIEITVYEKANLYVQDSLWCATSSKHLIWQSVSNLRPKMDIWTYSVDQYMRVERIEL